MKRLAFGFLLASLALPSALAQDFEILSVELREPSPTRAEISVAIRNNRATASNYTVEYEVAGAPALASFSSTTRLNPGDRASISLAFDPSGRARPINGFVVARDHRRRETDREPLSIPGTAPAEFVVVPERRTILDRDLTIQPSPSSPLVSEISLALTTGADDLGRTTNVSVALFAPDGEPLTGGATSSRPAGQDPRWNAFSPLTGAGAPVWGASGSTQTFTLPLLRAVPPDQIDRVLIRAIPGSTGSASDNWDLDRVQVRAGDRLLSDHRGSPYHRFGKDQLPIRSFQIALIPPETPVDVVRVNLWIGDDGVEASSRVLFQVRDREGGAIGSAFHAPQLPGPFQSGFIEIPIPRTPAGRIGSVEIVHEAPRPSGLFQNRDAWTLNAVEIGFGARGPETVQHLNVRSVVRYTRSPVHRFDRDRAPFVIRIP